MFNSAASSHLLLHVAEMGEADQRAMAAGVSGFRLMEAAGNGVARVVETRRRRPVAVLCGPGNNGGDGFVAARRLFQAGYHVRVGLSCDPARLKGDAAAHFALWRGPVELIGPHLLDGDPIIIDALFGAGLDRPLAGGIAELVEEINRRQLDVVAVDVPSGLDGNSGQPLGPVLKASDTVTFCRYKPGHLLLPGRDLCGRRHLVDIGIPPDVLQSIGPRQAINDPDLWVHALPVPRGASHKYSRGHLVIRGGARMTGAGRLASRAARRVGAGLVTVVAPQEVLPIYAVDQPGLLVEPVSVDFAEHLIDTRRNAVLVGPGNGVGASTRAAAEAALATGRPVVIDADAITAFEGEAATLASAVQGPVVLTPHEGEFARLVGTGIDGRGRLEAARELAATLGAVVVLKGADTVIAAPDRLAAINDNASPDLATAGTGDVLAGFIAGLLAQGMPAFHAAMAAVWLHGAAASTVGAGLIAEDLPEAVSPHLASLRRRAAGLV